MRKILIVDDQAIVRIALKNQLIRIFNIEQTSFLFASNEQEALALVNENPYMIIMNLHLGKEFGSEVYIKLCKINPQFENITVGFSSNLNDINAWNAEIRSKFINIPHNQKPAAPPIMKYCLTKPPSTQNLDTLIKKFEEARVQEETPSMFPCLNK